MLKRIANHLFWTARYLERAEWRARLADVNYHLLVESSPANQDAWAPLLAIAGERDAFAERYAAPEEQAVLNFFTFDWTNPSSIRSCVGFARENCRSLRNRISSELWLEVNALYLDSQRWTPEQLASIGVYGFFSELRERFHRISGVIQSTLSRDIGYDFLVAGKALESAENLSRLLDVKYHFLLPRSEDVGSPLDLAQWAAVLRSASALEAYRNTYGNTIQIDRVVEFLLFDPAFPRAARFSIERLEGALARIAASDPRGRCARERVRTARLLGLRLRSGSAEKVIENGLHDCLLEIQEDCAKISDEVFAEYLKFE